MKIDELDERQGLTREMVDHYLNRTGWCNMPDPDIRLLKPQYAHVSLKMGLSAAVERIASIEGRSVQSLLREINPRMREWPSREAVASHNGPWVARRGASPAILCTLRQDGWMHTGHPTYAPWITKDDLSNAKEWRFWPCDEHGNKVRWPTDAQGNML